MQPTIELDDGHVVDNPIGVAGTVDPEDAVLRLVLATLSAERAVVDQTVQPTRASLWLRPEGP